MNCSIIRRLFLAAVFIAGAFFMVPSSLRAQVGTVNRSDSVSPLAAGGKSENVSTYVINPLDRLLIVVYASDKQTAEYQKYVQSDGTVYLPFIE